MKLLAQLSGERMLLRPARSGKFSFEDKLFLFTFPVLSTHSDGKEFTRQTGTVTGQFGRPSMPTGPAKAS
ncbi:hypothetical protein [Aminobacter aminovorans]|uniref:hypothetical protein n=1 Tax=Aminobacter aminovorans TaxID=83263 RepID=UPI001049E45C|nr:hypothetical protein [Aminobacter aminovorans]